MQTRRCAACADDLPHKIELHLALDRPHHLFAVEVDRVRDDGSKLSSSLQVPCELDLSHVIGDNAADARYALVAVLEHVGDIATSGHWKARTRRLHKAGRAAAHIDPLVAASVASSGTAGASESIFDVLPRQWLLFDDAQRPRKISFFDVASAEASVLLYEQVLYTVRRLCLSFLLSF